MEQELAILDEQMKCEMKDNFMTKKGYGFTHIKLT